MGFNSGKDNLTDLEVDDGTLSVDASGNKVGVGTTSPSNVLQCNHTGADGDDGLLIVRSDSSTADTNLLGGIGFDSTDGNVPSSITEASAFIAAYAAEAHGSGDKGGDLVFGTSVINDDDDTTSTEHMRILDSGKVGIGTTSPKTKLTVEGTVTIKEQANADADTAAYGQLWVKNNATECQLYFTTDTGDDIQITSGTALASSAGSTAADDIDTGDAAVDIITTVGNITLDAQANDADIIFKVDDAGAAVTALTLDGSDEGNAVFVNDLKLQSDSAAIHFGANNDIVLTHDADRGLILTQATETTAEPVLTIKTTGNFASAGGIEFLLDNGAGEGDDDVLGFLSFKGDDAGDAETQFAKISVLSSDVTNTDEGGQINFEVMAGGEDGTAAMANLLSIGGEDVANSAPCEVVINEGQINCDFRVESNNYAHTVFVDGSSGNVGINNPAPKTSLDVYNSFQATTFENIIAAGVGGGQKLLYSPGADDTLTAGQIYFLHTDGTWDACDGDAVATGASQLLGIGLGGSSQTVGVVLEGFFRVPTTEILNTPGSGAVDGLPVYISTTAGHFDFTAPAGSGDFVRIVGYAIDDHSGDVLVYFKPDRSWVEIA